MRRLIVEKENVYGLGILIMEVLAGKNAVSDAFPKSDEEVVMVKPLAILEEDGGVTCDCQ